MSGHMIPPILFLLKISFGYLGSFVVPINFRFSSNFEKSAIGGILIGIALNMYIALG